MPADVAMLRGRTFAGAVAEQVDQTGARMLEAWVWPPADVEMRSLVTSVSRVPLVHERRSS